MEEVRHQPWSETPLLIHLCHSSSAAACPPAAQPGSRHSLAPVALEPWSRRCGVPQQSAIMALLSDLTS